MPPEGLDRTSACPISRESLLKARSRLPMPAPANIRDLNHGSRPKPIQRQRTNSPDRPGFS
jgi:hypothetical protein